MRGDQDSGDSFYTAPKTSAQSLADQTFLLSKSAKYLAGQGKKLCLHLEGSKGNSIKSTSLRTSITRLSPRVHHFLERLSHDLRNWHILTSSLILQKLKLLVSQPKPNNFIPCHISPSRSTMFYNFNTTDVLNPRLLPTGQGMVKLSISKLTTTIMNIPQTAPFWVALAAALNAQSRRGSTPNESVPAPSSCNGGRQQ